MSADKHNRQQTNWAAWSIEHRQLVYFFAFLVLVMGLFAFKSLGRSEDPSFAVKQMVVSAAWPGASAKDVEMHLTNTIEKEIQNLPQIDKITSYSRPGSCVITVTLKDEVTGNMVRQRWLELRNMVGDAQSKLPTGSYGPYYNDRFDDVYGNIYALTGDGYSYEDMRRYAEKIKLDFFAVPDVKKVELVGVQPEKIYVQMQADKLARLGLDLETIAATVKAQTAVTPSGMVETDTANAYLRISGSPSSVENIAAIPINANGKVFRLGDIAQISRGYADPPDPLMYYNGQPAVGVAISMEDGGNNIRLGENLAKEIERIQRELPLGLELNQVANQPEVVKASISEFSQSLYEAIIIVLAVSLFSLGRRAGYVISCCIPLILLGSFAAMLTLGIDLHKVSLGALVISLGMLVDDAIVVVELMEVKMSEGMERKEAASYAFKTCAWPLFTGTVITCLGFMPIAFSQASASEFAYSLFPVMSVTLLLSWLVSATLAPVLGYEWIRPSVIKADSYDSFFYRQFRSLLQWSLKHKAIIVGVTAAVLCFSVYMLRFVSQEFFPASVRPELLVELNLPEGSSIKNTDAAARKLTELIKDDEDLDHVSTYIGKSAPRFVLVIDPVQPRDNYAQLVVVAKSVEARQRLDKRINQLAAEQLPEAVVYSRTIPLGPPAPYPVMLRVSGSDDKQVKEYAQKVREVMAAHPYVNMTRLDWLEQSNAVKITIDNDKLLQMGLTRQAVATALQAQVSGYTAATYLEGDQEIGIVFRLDPKERADISQLEAVAIPTASGAVTLSQVARVEYTSEDNMIWRRNLRPTITVNGGLVPGVTGNDVTQQIYDQLAELRSQLPAGMSIEIGGSLEDSKKTLNYLLQPVPLMILLIMILIMLQLQDIRKLVVIMLTAPMGIIGVIFGLLLFNASLGFMAELGILALTGTIIRNSMVIVDQIQQHLDAGMTQSEAIVESAIVRFRPIMLAAFTTVLGLIPMFASQFWNAMAVAIACGLTGATLLTLVVLPVLYAIIFRVKA
ncbi:MAG: efflux RND transporter permease subunit [Phascolarctobacterium sp.]|uniref:efflux RND transporter permease subunit n=1 Tax=Phascolarctobacterium sp. TaxID=2049039 RepID=UPI0026DC939F|nr:efflux RND transporter permease subunit [Phascolarctobacterium sp.]MDO4921288.1 efflux RND transporter permease subunit [Phascolarctobacterium sp.]